MAEKPKLTDDELAKIHVMLEQMSAEQKEILILSQSEIQELQDFLNDKAALGRVWSISRTILITIAGTIIAWNVVIGNTGKIIAAWLGIGK